VQLGKLRAAFGDPLLLPGPRGMLPTARALALLAPLQAVLAQLELVLQPERRSIPPRPGAGIWRRRRRTGADPAAHAAGLRAQAPCRAWPCSKPCRRTVAQDLESGQVDRVSWRRKKRRPACATAPCLRALRAGGPPRPPAAAVAARPRPVLRWNSSSSRPTAAVSAARVDAALEQLGRTRQVVLSVPHS
jgi:DNA-binding transcriptional LysR family regulator